MKRYTPLFTLAALALAACQDTAPTGVHPSTAPLADKGGNGKGNGNGNTLAAGLTSSPGGIVPNAVDGNTSGDGSSDCSKLFPGSMAVKVDGNYDQTVAGYAFHVSDGTTLSFSRSSPGYAITGVLVKGGSAYDAYNYSKRNDGMTLGVTADGGLTSPRVGNDGKNIPDISHYVVCYVRNIHVEKKLVAVMTTLNGSTAMVPDGSWSSGGPVVIPQGQTRWLRFEITYEQAPGASGTLTENGPEVCGSLGGGFGCSSPDFTTSDPNSGKFPVTGSGTKTITLDIKNNGCGDGTLTNKVMFDAALLGTSASASVTIQGQCVQKRLVNVYTSDGSNGMTKDLTYMDGKVTIPQGQTRWLEYQIDYTLPAGVSANLRDDVVAACNTLISTGPNQRGTFSCTTAGFEGFGGQSLTVTGTDTRRIIVDIKNESGCGDRTFKNTAVLSRAGSDPTVSAPAEVMIWTPNCS